MTEGKALIASLNNQKALEQLSVDGSEVIIDQVLEHGLLKDIPIVKSVVAIAKAGLGLRDRIFLRKIFRFLGSIDTATAEEKTQFSEKFGNSDFGDNLLLTLEKADAMEKAKYIGKAFNALLKGEIDVPQFQRLSAAINKCNMTALTEITEIYGGMMTPHKPVLYDELFQAGFMTFWHGGAAMGGGRSTYMHNDLGKLFVKHCLGIDIN